MMNKIKIPVNIKSVRRGLKKFIGDLQRLQWKRNNFGSTSSKAEQKKISRKIGRAAKNLKKFNQIINNIPDGFHLEVVKMPNKAVPRSTKTPKRHLKYNVLKKAANDISLRESLTKMGISTDKQIEKMRQGRVPQSENGANFDIAVTSKHRIGSPIPNIKRTALDDCCLVPSWLCVAGKLLEDIQMSNPYLVKNGGMLVLTVSPDANEQKPTIPCVEGGFQEENSLKDRVNKQMSPI